MARVSPKTAFINIPYDDNYQDLYLAFIAGLVNTMYKRVIMTFQIDAARPIPAKIQSPRSPRQNLPPKAISPVF